MGNVWISEGAKRHCSVLPMRQPDLARYFLAVTFSRVVAEFDMQASTTGGSNHSRLPSGSSTQASSNTSSVAHKAEQGSLRCRLMVSEGNDEAVVLDKSQQFVEVGPYETRDVVVTAQEAGSSSEASIVGYSIASVIPKLENLRDSKYVRRNRRTLERLEGVVSADYPTMSSDSEDNGFVTKNTKFVIEPPVSVKIMHQSMVLPRK